MPDTSVNLTATSNKNYQGFYCYSISLDISASMQLYRTRIWAQLLKSGRVRFLVEGNGRRESELSVGLEHPVGLTRPLFDPPGELGSGDQEQRLTGTSWTRRQVTEAACITTGIPLSHTHPICILTCGNYCPQVILNVSFFPSAILFDSHILYNVIQKQCKTISHHHFLNWFSSSVFFLIISFACVSVER